MGNPYLDDPEHVNNRRRIEGEVARYLAAHPGAGDVSPLGPDAEDRPAPASGADHDLVIRGARVLTDAGIAPREIGVRHGMVTAVEPLGAGLRGARVVELAEGETLIPGVIDAHVHVNEPGRTEWEGFASATKAAAAGGVTTIIDMPLNSLPSTVNRPALRLKRMYARDQVFVDVGFWGGAVPGNRPDLRELHEDGVFGFKCFLLPSGVDEYPPLTLPELEEDLAELAGFDGLMTVHAEDAEAIDRAPQPAGSYASYLGSRPRDAENLAIAEIIERVRWTGARAHILHVSSSDVLPMIRSAQAEGLRITAESCPHYLTLTAEDIPDGATAYKCAPPIREKDNRDALWAGLLDGTIHDIASDHSPSTLVLKDVEGGDFGTAWGGVASLQVILPVIWTEARRRGIGLARVLDWMSAKPAQRLGLERKGRLAVGYDADLAVFAADEAFTVDAARLHHKNPITPYQGRRLSGVVHRTFVRGAEVDFRTPRGRLIRRGQA